MMEAASTSATSVNFYQTTRRNNPEDSHLHTRRSENLKSHTAKLTCPFAYATHSDLAFILTLNRGEAVSATRSGYSTAIKYSLSLANWTEPRVGRPIKRSVFCCSGAVLGCTIGRLALRCRDGGTPQRIVPAAIAHRESPAPRLRSWGGLQPVRNTSFTGKPHTLSAVRTLLCTSA
jgi:hypothetical protein